MKIEEIFQAIEQFNNAGVSDQALMLEEAGAAYDYVRACKQLRRMERRIASYTVEVTDDVLTQRLLEIMRVFVKRNIWRPVADELRLMSTVKVSWSGKGARSAGIHQTLLRDMFARSLQLPDADIIYDLTRVEAENCLNYYKSIKVVERNRLLSEALNMQANSGVGDLYRSLTLNNCEPYVVAGFNAKRSIGYANILLTAEGLDLLRDMPDEDSVIKYSYVFWRELMLDEHYIVRARPCTF